jgi:hypothetical protein
MGDLRDYSNPVIRLQNLTAEDLCILLLNIRNVYAGGDISRHIVPDEAIKAYIQHCARRLGAEFYQTPGDAVKGFVGFLSVLDQNRNTDWQTLLGGIDIQPSKDPDSFSTENDETSMATKNGKDELTTFRL